MPRALRRLQGVESGEGQNKQEKGKGPERNARDRKAGTERHLEVQALEVI